MRLLASLPIPSFWQVNKNDLKNPPIFLKKRTESTVGTTNISRTIWRKSGCAGEKMCGKAENWRLLCCSHPPHPACCCCCRPPDHRHCSLLANSFTDPLWLCFLPQENSCILLGQGRDAAFVQNLFYTLINVWVVGATSRGNWTFKEGGIHNPIFTGTHNWGCNLFSYASSSTLYPCE